MNEAVDRSSQLGNPAELTRRRFLESAFASVAVGAWASKATARGGVQNHPAFQNRGVVLIPEDLTWTEWPERAAAVGLTTVALHHGRSVFEVVKRVNSDSGQALLRRVQHTWQPTRLRDSISELR